MTLSEEIRHLLLKGASSDDIKAQATNEGMITMRRAAMLKVRQRVTTPQEVIRNVFSTM